MIRWLFTATLAALALAPISFAATARADEPAPAASPATPAAPAPAAPAPDPKARAAAKLEWDALSASVGALGKVVESGDPGGRMTAAHNEAVRRTTAAYKALDAGDLVRATTEMRGGWGALSPVFDDFLERSDTNAATELSAKTAAATSAWIDALASQAGSEAEKADLESATSLHAEAATLRGSDRVGAFEKEREALAKVDDAFRLMAAPPAGV